MRGLSVILKVETTTPTEGETPSFEGGSVQLGGEGFDIRGWRGKEGPFL